MSRGALGRYLRRLWRREKSQNHNENPKFGAYVAQDENRKTVFVLLDLPKSEGWHPKEHKHRRFELGYWVFSLLLSLAVAVGAGLSAGYTYDAAGEAKRQADIADSALKTSQRAWIFPSKAQIVGSVGIGDIISENSIKINMKITFNNSGLSPAIHALSYINIFFNGQKEVYASTCPSVEKNYKSTINHEDAYTGYFIAPNSNVDILLGDTNRTASFFQIKNVNFYVVGCIRYEDQFRRVHHTRYCFQPPNGGALPVKSDAVFDICEAFSEID